MSLFIWWVSSFASWWLVNWLTWVGWNFRWYICILVNLTLFSISYFQLRIPYEYWAFLDRPTRIPDFFIVFCFAVHSINSSSQKVSWELQMTFGFRVFFCSFPSLLIWNVFRDENCEVICLIQYHHCLEWIIYLVPIYPC